MMKFPLKLVASIIPRADWTAFLETFLTGGGN